MSSMDNAIRPTVFVIFGITGDLSQRKLLPALYHLLKDGLLHDQTRIIGLSRQSVNTDELLKKVELCVLESDKVCDPATLKRFQGMLTMLQFDPTNAADYQTLKGSLEQLESAHPDSMNRLFYLSIPPKIYTQVVTNLGEAGFGQPLPGGRTTALLVEKPFGFDSKSAEELIRHTEAHFDAAQVYRIDHYLAKETVQNILTFRRQNPLFQQVWNSRTIHTIEVVAYEKLGLEGRLFYDGIGALRDVVQSHLMQLLALVTMEIPASLGDSAVHEAKEALLQSIEPVPAERVAERALRGQYAGYKEEVGNPDSDTETYAKIELRIPTERWQNTKFVLASGKAMAEKQTAIRVHFGDPTAAGNTLSFQLQPNEGIAVTLQVKRPGFAEDCESAVMHYDYAHAAHPDAYERVLVDALRGEHQLFTSDKEVMASWRALQPVLDAWQTNGDGLVLYEQGSEAVNRA